MYPPPTSPQGIPPHQAWVPDGGPDVRWAVGLWVVAALSLIGTLLFAGLATYGFWISNHMDENGVSTPAVVAQVDGDEVTVEFTAENGESVTAEITWMSFDVPASGDEVNVTYDPDDVTYAVPGGSNEDRILAIVFAVIASLGLLVTSGATIGAILVHRARSRNSAAAPSAT